MAESEANSRLSMFMKSGIYRFENCNAVFMDPVRVLNRSYPRFRVSPSAYYTRFFDSNNVKQEEEEEVEQPLVLNNSRKRKRKEKKPYTLNEREQVADQRHQEVRPLLVKAHESLLGAADSSEILRSLRDDRCLDEEHKEPPPAPIAEQSFVQLGRVWQSHFYEINLDFHHQDKPIQDEGNLLVGCKKQKVVPLFNNLVTNDTNKEVKAEFCSNNYIIPKKSCFYMSDMGQIQNLIPANSDRGFNLILVDPPWENGSARQKSKYPTLPNKYFLSLPIKKLSHRRGALLALWVTNREKLRGFVEKELFPAWGVKYAATLFWLKVRGDGSLITDMDLFHHRPYECLLLGYCHGEDTDSEWWVKKIEDDQVVISVPGDYSRKPPVGELLVEHVPPCLRPARCIELFAREMMAGWSSWGNEPLRFQDLRYFQERIEQDD